MRKQEQKAHTIMADGVAFHPDCSDMLNLLACKVCNVRAVLSRGDDNAQGDSLSDNEV